MNTTAPRIAGGLLTVAGAYLPWATFVLNKGPYPANATLEFFTEPLAVSGFRLHLLLKKYTDGDEDAHERGEETRQLDVSYGGGPLSRDAVTVGSLRAGDRAPDGVVAQGRLFDVFRGGDWTLLTHEPLPTTVGVPTYVTDVYEAPIVLVRPDGYVGLVTDKPADVEDYLRLVTLR